MIGKPLVMIDLETFGLDTERDQIMELGLVILDDHDLKVMNYREWVVSGYQSRKRAESLLRRWHAGQINESDSDWFCAKTHSVNGLLEQVAGELGDTADKVSNEAANWLTELLETYTDLETTAVLNKPMAGNSVHFDRAMLTRWMPELSEVFTYRNEDISAIKSFVDRWMPKVAAHRDSIKTEAIHRVEHCLNASLAELEVYKEFVFV